MKRKVISNVLKYATRSKQVKQKSGTPALDGNATKAVLPHISGCPTTTVGGSNTRTLGRCGITTLGGSATRTLDGSATTK